MNAITGHQNREEIVKKIKDTAVIYATSPHEWTVYEAFRSLLQPAKDGALRSFRQSVSKFPRRQVWVIFRGAFNRARA